MLTPVLCRNIMVFATLMGGVAVPALAQQGNTLAAPAQNTLVPITQSALAPVQTLQTPRLEPLLSPSAQQAQDAAALIAQQQAGAAARQAAQQQTQQQTAAPTQNNGQNNVQNNGAQTAPTPSAASQNAVGGFPVNANSINENAPGGTVLYPQPQLQPVTMAAAPPQTAEKTIAASVTPVITNIPAKVSAPETPETEDDMPTAGAPALPAPNPAALTPVANNTGITMALDPNMVGGFDPNVPPQQSFDQLPYEVQLQMRTMELQQSARQLAYEQAKRNILPLETYEIRDLLARLKNTQEAIQTPVRPAPKPGNVIRTVSTDPAAKPKIIHLAVGNVTTLNIIDVTGEPWPIVDIGFGGPFDVKPPEPGGHVVRITPLKDFGSGNLVIRLLKMTTPITFQLRAGGSKVDYRFDARIPEYGPNARLPIVDDGIKATAGDRVTTSFLEGVPPTGAQKLHVEGVTAATTAWRFAGALYVRTPLSLLSPAWNGSATSADGMNVYVMSDAPVLLLSDKGNLVRAHLSEMTP